MPRLRARARGARVAMSSLLEQLIEAFRVLPGVGQKTAQRMAYHVLEREREGGRRLAETLAAAVERIGHCARCRDFSESTLCATCASSARDAQTLCAVESPADRLAIEQATGYRGLYFVLQGRLSPLDGIGPRELGLDRLIARATDGAVREVILATNFTNEGEATAHTVATLLGARGLRVSRLSRGVPVGGELEHTDTGTIAQALLERRPL